MFEYNFDLETELKIYRKVGNKNGFCNYSEWENYVLNKYGNKRYTESSLKNFLHYLKKNQRVIVSKKESWSSTIMPMVILIITILSTSVFSIIGVINNYNDAINTFTDEEFRKYSGYSVEMIYSALEQNLYSGMYFYIFAMIIVSFVIIAMIMLMTSKIGEYNLRESFYYDYIQIIKSIIENKKMDKYRKNR